MGKLQKLENRYYELQNILQETKNEIEELKTKKRLPELKKKYEGKYFKYKNSYSDRESWWLYYYCKKVDDCYYTITNNFQEKTDGFEFDIDSDTSINLLGEEISHKEYNTALNKFLENAKRI